MTIIGKEVERWFVAKGAPEDCPVYHDSHWEDYPEDGYVCLNVDKDGMTCHGETFIQHVHILHQTCNNCKVRGVKFPEITTKNYYTDVLGSKLTQF